MNMNIENIGEFLKDNNIKPSYQRLKIYEYLMGTKAHPTVDMIYRALMPEIPTLSKTTVYNTLNLFVDNGIAQLITIEENESRYDADISLHGHFKCEQCGMVYDFDVEQSAFNFKGLDDFTVSEKHVYFKGLCKSCNHPN